MKICQYNPIDFEEEHPSCVLDTQKNIPKDAEYTLLTNPTYRSHNLNFIKFKFLIDNPAGVWIEPDIKIIRWWEPPKDNFLYLNFSTTIIFGNDVFKKVFTDLVAEFKKNDRGCRWVLPQLKKLGVEMRLIPSGCFQIILQDMHRKCKHQKDNDACKLKILFKEKTLSRYLNSIEYAKGEK
jgi:hypothetical protein